MNIKHLLLSALFTVSFAIQCNDDERAKIGAAIAELTAKIKELSEEIAQQEEKVAALDKKAEALYETYIAQQEEKLKKDGLAEEVVAQKIADIETEFTNVCRSFFEEPNESVSDLSLQELMGLDKANCVLMKFSIAQYFYERMQLASLLRAWEIHVKRLMRIYVTIGDKAAIA